MIPKTIWVVERGEFADYEVVGVFSTREHAQRIADALNASDPTYYPASIDEWPLDPDLRDLQESL